MLHEIAPAVYRCEYVPKPPVEGDIVFVFRKGLVLSDMSEDMTFRFPRAEEFEDAHRLYEDGKLLWLFRIDDVQFFLIQESEITQLTGYRFERIYFLRRMRPRDLCFAAVTAYHLYNWYNDNRFCSRCGKPMTLCYNGERALICSDPDCARIVYPRINPAIIAGVISGDMILITRYREREYKGPSLVAGFIEIGEMPEETVRREVLEETGIHVKNIRYYGSQPWGFDSGLLLGYYCEAVDPKAVHADGDELSDALWLPKDRIIVDPSLEFAKVTDDAVLIPTHPTSLTVSMIHHFAG